MRAFPVRMPSGTRYWTVVDDDLVSVDEADRFLRELRLGRGRAETTTKAYAESICLFLTWCLLTKRDWGTAAQDMGLFMLWLRWTPGNGGERRVVVPGPGSKPVRTDGRINKVLTAVRGFLAHGVVNKSVPGWILEQIYELGDTNDLPSEARGEDSSLRYRLRARHRLQEPETDVDRASDEEIVAMFLACRSARDRLIVLLLARVGLRRGQAAGLRRTDAHLLMDSRSLGCDIEGAHLHVVRRQNVNNAWSKSRKSHALPVDFLVVQAFDQYMLERHGLLGAAAATSSWSISSARPMARPSPQTRSASSSSRWRRGLDSGGISLRTCVDMPWPATSVTLVALSMRYRLSWDRSTRIQPGPTCTPNRPACVQPLSGFLLHGL